MCQVLIIKVSGAKARWPFTDSAVPSSLLLFLWRSGGLQSADLLLILRCSFVIIIILIKVSGATARWPVTDSAVPSSSADLYVFVLLLCIIIKVSDLSWKPFCFRFVFSLFLFIKVCDFSRKTFCFRFVFS